MYEYGEFFRTITHGHCQVRVSLCMGDGLRLITRSPIQSSHHVIVSYKHVYSVIARALHVPMHIQMLTVIYVPNLVSTRVVP